MQQAFLELVRAADSLRGGFIEIRAWLYSSVRFACLDEMRRRRRRPEVPVADTPEVPGHDETVATAIDALPDPELADALDDLTEAQRTAVLLTHVAGLSGNEVARVLGSNRVAVYALVKRAEARLRRSLASDPAAARRTSTTTEMTEEVET